MNIQEMTVRFSEKQDEIVKSVAKKMKLVQAFECEGQIFYGSSIYAAAVLFAYNNPEGGDFYVWLQDNYKTLVPAS